ncbi:MAG TPA: hypothetical protein VF401_03235 [Candidatus Saccharimonadales bacterium]
MSSEIVFDVEPNAEFNQSDKGVVLAARQGMRHILAGNSISEDRRERVERLATKIDLACVEECFVSFDRTEARELVMAIDYNSGYEMVQAERTTGVPALFSGAAKVAEQRRHELTDFIQAI